MASKFIIFTGPESSGKTFLAKYLAHKYDLPYIEETARKHLDTIGLDYAYKDLELIARQHISNENNYHSKSENIIVDTDLITLLIWSEDVFKKVSPYITDQLNHLKSNRHYLLLQPDISWQADPQRQNEYDRDRLFDLYESKLIHYKLSYTIVNGNYLERTTKAEKYIKGLIN